jgi:hypothetical protein
MEGFQTGQVVYHGAFGTGRIVNIDEEQGQIAVNFIKAGAKIFTIDTAEEELSDTPLQPASAEAGETYIDEELKETIRQVLLEEGMVGVTPIAGKWEGGELILKPGTPGLQEKPVPIDAFFHKIVMVRNQLRLLEQNINSSQKLTDAEKVDLQQYITRCYGSLTTFNILFAEKKDWFVGSKKE